MATRKLAPFTTGQAASAEVHVITAPKSAVGFNGYSDIYENGRDLVDATVQYKTKKMEFKLGLTDLLSQGTILYQKVPSRNLINTINEKTISLSLNYKL